MSSSGSTGSRTIGESNAEGAAAITMHGAPVAAASASRRRFRRARACLARASPGAPAGAQPIEVRCSGCWAVERGDTAAVLVRLPPPSNPLDAAGRAVARALAVPLASMNWVRVCYDGRWYGAAPLPEKDVWRALVPTTPLDRPGRRRVRVEAGLGRDGFGTDAVLEVHPRPYPTQSIWLAEDKAGLTPQPEEIRRVADLVDVRSPWQLWRSGGRFVEPAHGPITTAFGVSRYYNGVLAKGYYHRGLDYGAPRGAAVRSPAPGKVVLVGDEREGFAFHGNCVGVDHGQGVVSLLMHLQTTAVREGDSVGAGAVVGTVGDSGIATGPHLHWGLYVHGRSVDPNPWLEHTAWMDWHACDPPGRRPAAPVASRSVTTTVSVPKG